MPQPSPTKKLWTDLLQTLAFCLAIAISLLVFPSSMLWMIGFWLALPTIGRYRERATWLPLIACVAIVIIKRPDWPPAFLILVVAIGVVGVVALIRRTTQSNASARFAQISIGVAWCLWLVALWDSHATTHVSRPLMLDPARPIVCLGDSLTTGLSDQEAYPRYLAEQLSAPVLNFGRAGITARDALSSLPEIIAARPQAVVIELGGHDFLRGYGRERTRESLVKIIEGCQRIGAAVVLVEIPRGFITDPFSGLERELAREYDLELVPDTPIRMLVLRSSTFPLSEMLSLPILSEDGLHPNSDGARHLAKAVQAALRTIYDE